MSKLFLEQWHLVEDLLPPADEIVWFLDKEGSLRIGQYNEEVYAIGMSDGYGVKLEDVKQWMFLTSREVAGYPKDGETIAVELKALDCPTLGMYTCRFDDPISGLRKKAVLLDPIYNFENAEGEVALEWPYVLAWYRAPEIEELRSFEGFTYEEDSCCLENECLEEEPLCGPEPLRGPEPLCEAPSAEEIQESPLNSAILKAASNL